MELLSFHNQFVADFAGHDQYDNFVTLDIIQGAQVSCTQFKLGQRIGSQSLDCFRRCRGLVLKPGQNGRFQDSLVTSRQGPKLPFAVLGDGDLERHATNRAPNKLTPECLASAILRLTNR